jgi:hypothetical protein
MKKVALIVVAVASIVPLIAGSAHFVGAPQFTISDSQVLVTGKVAGLGNIPQIHVVATGDAACINNGGNHPQAGNKESFSSEGDFPVQNGKSLFSLVLTATFQPECSPPMIVAWSNLSVTVTADDGTFITFP